MQCSRVDPKTQTYDLLFVFMVVCYFAHAPAFCLQLRLSCCWLLELDHSPWLWSVFVSCVSRLPVVLVRWSVKPSRTGSSSLTERSFVFLIACNCSLLLTINVLCQVPVTVCYWAVGWCCCCDLLENDSSRRKLCSGSNFSEPLLKCRTGGELLKCSSSAYAYPLSILSTKFDY